MNEAKQIQPKNEETVEAIRSGIAQERVNRASAGIMAMQVFSISILVGLLKFSWFWFLGTLIVLIAASTSKRFGKAVAVLFGMGWTATGVAIGSFFGSDGMAAVLGILGFAFGCGINLRGMTWTKDVK